MIKNPAFDLTTHKFTQNPIEVLANLPKVSMDELRSEPSFSRTEWDDALKIAGPNTLKYLEMIEPHLLFDRRHVLVDVQIQFLKKGQYTTNKGGTAWHIDGATSVHRVLANFLLGKENSDMMLDMDDSLTRSRKMRFYSFFLGDCSRTEYIAESLNIVAPKCITSFEVLSDMVEKSKNKTVLQNPLELVRFDDTILHRASSAQKDGWRYWIRIGEIDFIPPPRDRHIDTVYDPIM